MKSIFRILLFFIITVGLPFGLYFLFRVHNTKVLQIVGSRMEPTFKDGCYLRLKNGPFKISELRRGDIISHTIPRDSSSLVYIHRIIGLPGERIQIKEGGVLVNDTKLFESYLPTNFYTSALQQDEEVALGLTSFYVLRDNRKHYIEPSRVNIIDAANITGKLVEYHKGCQ